MIPSLKMASGGSTPFRALIVCILHTSIKKVRAFSVMEMRRIVWMSCLLAMSTMASYAPALEEPSPDEQDRRPSWNASVAATWLQGSGIDDHEGDVTMREASVGLGRRFMVSSNLDLSAGMRYSTKNIDAPEALRLPESLHSVSVSFGGEYRIRDDLMLGLMVSPGLSSDFKEIDSEDLRMHAGVHALYRLSRRFSVVGGVAYKGGSEWPVIPIVGLQYQPSEQWAFSLGVPRTAIVFKPQKGMEIFVEGEFSGGGDYELHDASLRADSVSYQDYRAVTGFDFPLTRVVRLKLSGGYAFGRKFDFSDGQRDDIKLEATPFGRLEVKFSW